DGRHFARATRALAFFNGLLEHNAAALILVHNHPSGDPEPSMADRNLTTKLQDALNLVGVRTLDHIVVGQEDCVSLAERGYL
ncbi:JAB domain-containing protein, partial [Pseudomonas aeruginosa]|uniref:JAB domain-containing protein n=1 Tax=Pseudomonas aeruginosa TaxID=287 RepID=UPI001D39228D